MKFNLRAMDADAQEQQKSIQHSQSSSTFSFFTKPVIPGQIRAEILAEAMARKRILEAEVRNELMMEREMAMRNAGEIASPITSQPLPARHKNLFMSEILHRQSMEEKLVMLNDGKYSLGGRLSEIRGFPVSPFRLLGDSPKIKRIHSPEFNEKKVIDLSKPDDETISGTKRKPSPEVSECSSQHGSERSNKKVKEEWSCAVCQVSATSERGLKDHLQGKKHQTKQAGLVAQITGANFGLGVEPKNPTIGLGSSEETKSLTRNLLVDQTQETSKPSNTSDSNDIKKKKTKKDVFKFWCEMCQVGAFAEKVMNDHTEGKKHSTRLVEYYKKSKVDSEASATVNTCRW